MTGLLPIWAEASVLGLLSVGLGWLTSVWQDSAAKEHQERTIAPPPKPEDILPEAKPNILTDGSPEFRDYVREALAKTRNAKGIKDLAKEARYGYHMSGARYVFGLSARGKVASFVEFDYETARQKGDYARAHFVVDSLEEILLQTRMERMWEGVIQQEERDRRIISRLVEEDLDGKPENE